MTRLKCITEGRSHNVIVSKNGTIFTLSNNSYGQCVRMIIKDEVYKASHIVYRIEKEYFTDDEVVPVECGQDYTMFLTQSGKVCTCG